MVIASASVVETVSGTSGKLRRSRRLSSTRGLKTRVASQGEPTVREAAPEDRENRKPGPYAACSGRTSGSVDSRRRGPIDWELNERISLCSGSSAGLEVRADARRGLEFGENRRRPEADSYKRIREARVVKEIREAKGVKEVKEVKETREVRVAREAREVKGVKEVKKTREGREVNEVKEAREVRSTSKPALELLNVSGFPREDDARHRAGWSRDDLAGDLDGARRDWHAIKSDSKYEIGTPGDGAAFGKVKQRKLAPGGGTKSRKTAKGENGHAGLRGKRTVDKENDSISKRLELIHELNRKILANYERFQQRSRRGQSKDKEASKGGSVKEPAPGGRDAFVRKGNAETEERACSDATRKNRSKVDVARRGRDSPKLRHADANRLEMPRDRCEVLARGEKADDRKRKSSKDATGAKPGSSCDSNENFALATRPMFGDREAVSLERVASTSERSSDAGSNDEPLKATSVVHASEDFRSTDPKVASSPVDDRPESSELRPEAFPTIPVAKTTGDEDTVERIYPAKPRDDAESKSTTARYDSRPTNRSTRRGSPENDPLTSGLPISPDRNLEDEVLGNLDETIDRFDREKGLDEPGKSESFSTDSIQSCDESLADGSPKDSAVHETFNSSWDSGVGVDVGTGSGWVRIHTGVDSSLVYLTLDTTAKDVCRDMLLGDDLSLFIRYGGEPGRRLGLREKPLELQDAFLRKLGYQEASRRARLGVDPELRHLIAFHVGPASPLPDLSGYSRCGYALVLKGLVFPQWKRRPLAVIGSRLFLYPACPESRPEWMELGGGGAVCYAPSRLGKLVLRVTGFPRVTQQCHQSQRQEDSHHRETRHLYLGFHHPWDRDLWKGWLKHATQLPACPRKLDLSKGGLSRIPDSAVAFPAIEEVLLGQNQLANRDNNLALLHRFPKLHVARLECNGFKEIPRELWQLSGLTYLDLSDNSIEAIPPEITRLVSLEELILDRNGIKDIPEEVGQLRSLRNISLVGNHLGSLPLFLKMRALALTDVLSKADHGKGFKDERSNQSNLQKVNLRNNQLKGSIILGNYGNLTHLDVSENSIEKLDVSALQELRSVRCARNLLTELTLCGRNLVSLIAGNNKLKKLTVEPVPSNLEHLDVSYNNLDALPEWTPDLPLLRALFASHNALTALPDRLLSQPSRLEVLHLPHNRLQALPPPRRPLNIVHLTLQDNALTALPTTFFVNTEKLKVLNLSNNRLSELPYCGEGNRNRQHGAHTLEKLYLTANCLTDRALDTLAKFKALRVLHVAYNTLDTLPESCIISWSELEELVLSGNRLQYLPDNVANLRHLRVLRVHSNRLLTCPTFGKTASLKVLDLAHNQLDRVNLATLVPPQLQFLDISCNTRLHVDPRQFQVYRSQRPISLVDVSGQNRPSLPSHPHQQDAIAAEASGEQPWRLGFSETAGSREKLYISQVRMPSFCNVEGLFGLFDGGSNQEAPSALQEMIPRLLLEERTVRETSKEYLKYTLLSAHRELKEKGQKYGIDATLVHIAKVASPPGYPKSSSRYSLKVASSGEARAVLCRASGPLTLAAPKRATTTPLPPTATTTSTTTRNQLGNAAMFPLAVPDPSFEEVVLEDDDEFVIVANRRLWEVLSVQEAVREARAEASPVLAAKRLQDLAQAYGAEDNVSVVVVRLAGPRTGDLDQLMRELRHAVGKNRPQSEGGCACPCCAPPAPHKPPGPCCCHGGEGYYLNGVVKNIVNRSSKSHNGSGRYFKNTRSNQSHENESPPYRDDRSSPSGQSDQASDSTFKSRHPSGRVWSGSAASRAASKARQSVVVQENGTRKVSSCVSTQEDAASERSGALSEEQFRCWEYMLEQNTQLLFDKELDTLTRAPLRRGQSRSTPQLAGNLPFLSKRFGSARSFNPSFPRPPVVRFGSGRRLLNGGPNAAYFGSLQRLMPYNLEYDFAVIQERAGLDSLEQDATRMQQYWGVATTEL